MFRQFVGKLTCECVIYFSGSEPSRCASVGLQQRFKVTTRGSSGKLGGLHFDGPPETPHYRGGFIACWGFEILLGTSFAPVPLSTLAVATTGQRVRGRDFEPPWEPDGVCDGTDLP